MAKAVALIPAFNEAPRIAPVIAEARQHVAEVWVVDDGSSDNTAEVARAAGAQVIVHEKNQGKGASMLDGLAALAKTDADLIILLDADGQHDPREIVFFLEEHKKSGATVVCGNRMSDVRAMPLLRKLTNRTMSWLVTRATGQRIPDCSCGFRLLHRSVLADWNLETRGYDTDQEMLLQAARAGHRITSVAITTIYCGAPSHIRKVHDTIRFLKLLWRYRKKK